MVGALTGVGRSDGRALGATLTFVLGVALDVDELVGSGDVEGKSLGVGSGEGVIRGTIVATITGFF